MRNRTVLPAMLLLLAAMSSVLRAQNGEDMPAQRLQTVLDSMRVAQNIRGVSASVLLKNRSLWQGCSGESYAGAAITPDMEFGIGSNSKLFTAAVVLKLQESRLLDVDSALHTWLPRYRNIDSTITLRQLLNHTSGLADVNDVPGYPDTILADPTRTFAREEVLRWVGPPHFAPGSSWEYSNTNYILAGMIAEKAAGRPFVTLLRELLLTPLALDSTFLPVDETVSGTLAHPWSNGADISTTPRTSLLSAAWCAGAMYSNSGDMARWYRALFQEDALAEESRAEMTTFVGSGRYGFGIAEKQMGARTLYVHGGSIRGYTSQMLYDTTLHAVICVLTNELPAAAMLVAQQLLATLVRGTSTHVITPAVTTRTMEVYPIPAHNHIHLRIEQEVVRHVVLIDPLGRILPRECRTGSVDLSDVRPGVYFLEVAGTHGVTRTRVVVR